MRRSSIDWPQQIFNLRMETESCIRNVFLMKIERWIMSKKVKHWNQFISKLFVEGRVSYNMMNVLTLKRSNCVQFNAFPHTHKYTDIFCFIWQQL